MGQGDRGRENSFKTALPAYLAMMRSLNQRWDSKIEKLGTYWVLHRDLPGEGQRGILLPL